METLIFIFKLAMVSLGVGLAAILNIIVWGAVVVMLKRGKRHGNDKNIHKH